MSELEVVGADASHAFLEPRFRGVSIAADGTVEVRTGFVLVEMHFVEVKATPRLRIVDVCDECARWGYHLVGCSRGGRRG